MTDEEREQKRFERGLMYTFLWALIGLMTGGFAALIFLVHLFKLWVL